MDIRNSALTNIEVTEAPLVQQFSYTGDVQTLTVPMGVSRMRFTAVGAAGGRPGGVNVSKGGRGANITAVCNVTPLSTLYVYVGGYPTDSPNAAPIGGGGAGGTYTLDGGGLGPGYAGGGYTAVFTSNTPSQANVLVIAGGGGGAGPTEALLDGGNAASAWAGNGSAGAGSTGGGGGFINAAGTAGGNGATAGSALTGGGGGSSNGTAFATYGGGGGGGGYWGAGGGGWGNDTSDGGAGGAGSSYATGPIVWNGVGDEMTSGSLLAEAVPAPVTYGHSGGPQVYVVPQGVNQIKVTAVGARGGNSGDGLGEGGAGGNITTTLDVTPGQILTIVVGGTGRGSANTVPGYGFGGIGGLQGGLANSAGAGGGMSGVFTGRSITTANALCVAGGGGGAMSWASGRNGGFGGKVYPGDAQAGADASGDFGQNAGTGGSTSGATNGSAGASPDSQSTDNTGGNRLAGGRGGIGSRFSSDFGGGGGGAGWYGGGGGAGGGEASGAGGGGSSYSVADIIWGTPNTTGDGSVTVEPVIVDTDQFEATFAYTGAEQYWTAPPGVTSIKVNALGAAGGWGNTTTSTSAYPGGGANITVVAPVTGGTTYTVVVGGCPGQSRGAVYGYGGNGGNSALGRFGGAGGGLTGIFNGAPATANAVVVAGGGGGSGSFNDGSSAGGGDAGIYANAAGQNGRDYDASYGQNGGYGATVSAAGAAGVVFDTNSVAPTAGNGIQGGAGGTTSSNAQSGGTGGGGGYYGGGGGAAGGAATGGGGAGSSYTGAWSGNSLATISTGNINGSNSFAVFHGSMTITIVG